MKKFFSILTVATALLFTISCDKEEKKELDPVESLKGTEWQATNTVTEMGVSIKVTMNIELRADMTFEFGGDIDAGDFEIPGLEEDMLGEVIEGEWRYEASNVYMTAYDETIVGAVSGDIMVVSNAGAEDIFSGDIVFHKK